MSFSKGKENFNSHKIIGSACLLTLLCLQQLQFLRKAFAHKHTQTKATLLPPNPLYHYVLLDHIVTYYFLDR